MMVECFDENGEKYYFSHSDLYKSNMHKITIFEYVENLYRCDDDSNDKIVNKVVELLTVLENNRQLREQNGFYLPMEQKHSR